jgi:peroxiredoxin
VLTLSLAQVLPDTIGARLAADELSAETSLATIPRFSLSDAQGTIHSRDEFRAAKAVVLVFLGAECPVSNGYSPSFRQLHEQYAKRGVVVLGVHCDATLTALAAREHAKQYELSFATLLDPQQLLAHAAGVRVTPEVVVARPGGEVVYRGRIDNKYSLDGKRRDEPNQFELTAALEATLAGRLPDVRETKAFGCPLPRVATK